ncbi:MAG: radical SAM protein [Candidatus Omnitrophica bacterium]|nr:radical SAM protein [Candidatus Omnitrophota bacterium]HOX54581.1 radical SAM protein [Candidatus Omnitrophota bacterium]
MKIILIEPKAAEANVYSKMHMPLLGPVYLGTILKKAGHSVRIFNENIYIPDYSSLDADLIGISILTNTARRGYEIARNFPKEKVIIGGVHASLLPEESLTVARQVVVGEAEEVIVDIAEGRIKDAVVYGKRVEDLDTLPYPDFSLIEGYKFPAFVTPVSTSRGCPFDCSFCSVTKMFGREYRFRSPEKILEELQSRNTKQFFFCDDNFTANPKRTRDLLGLMLKEKIVKWTCQVRTDAAKDEKLVHLMAKAGCGVVCIGFESVNSKTLTAYQKKQTVGDIVDSIRSFHRRKIKIHGMFVLGGDDDSKNTIWDTVKFALKEKIDTIQMMILTPLPGTKVYDDLQKQKRIFTRDWNLYDGQHIVFAPKLLSARELQLNVTKAYEKFYSLYRSFFLLFRFRFRNAMFRFMGHFIIKKWLERNHKMSWLPKVYQLVPGQERIT